MKWQELKFPFAILARWKEYYNAFNGIYYETYQQCSLITLDMVSRYYQSNKPVCWLRWPQLKPLRGGSKTRQFFHMVFIERRNTYWESVYLHFRYFCFEPFTKCCDWMCTETPRSIGPLALQLMLDANHRHHLSFFCTIDCLEFHIRK